jgi:hypothetical protein
MVGATLATDGGSTVALRIERPSGNVVCTGTLVAPSVVLTAAHCIEDQTRVRVLTGQLDRSVTPPPADDFVATRVRESRDFEKGSKTTKPNDLAFIDLGRNATRPVAGIQAKRPKAGSTGFSRGYGTTDETADGKVPEGAASPLLREATVGIVACGKSDYADVFCSKFTSSTPDAGPCRGDSGGPLLTASQGKLVGVYSGTAKGCRGVSTYIDLAMHDEFVGEALAPRITGRVFDRAAVTAAEAKGARPDDARTAARLSGVVIKARRQDGTLASSTPSQSGHFTLPVESGKYDLEVIAKGYTTVLADDVVVGGPRAFDAGMTKGVSIVPGSRSGPQVATVVTVERSKGARIVADVSVNLPAGPAKQVRVTLTAPSVNGKPEVKAGSQTFTTSRPIARKVQFDLGAKAADRLTVGRTARLTITVDGTFVREVSKAVTAPAKATG